jgi:hypothetical protein
MSVFSTIIDKATQLTDNLFGSSNAYLSLGLSNSQVSQNKGARFAQAEEVLNYFGKSEYLTNTTYVGSGVASKRFFEYEQDFVTPEARKAFFIQLEKIRNDDPMINAGLYVLAQGAVADGFTFSFDNKNLTTNEKIAKTAMEQAQKLMNPVLGDWAENFIFFGDSYIQIISDKKDRLVGFEEMPVPGFERLSDHTDSFPDPQKAYRQRDAISRETYAYFSDFQVVNGRYRKRNGSPNGSSILFPVRQASIDAIKGYAGLEKIRKRMMPIPTYAPVDGEGNPLVGEALRRFKYGNPGDPSSALPEVRAERGDLSGVETDYPYRIANGGAFTVSNIDVKLGETKDLQSLVDRSLAVLGTPRGILTGDVVNYATLNALLKHLYSVERTLSRTFEYQVVRPIIDRVLLLAGILPETISYQINWGQKYTPQELTENAQLAINAGKEGYLDKQTVTETIVEALGRKDAKEVLERLEKERNSLALTPTVSKLNQEPMKNSDTNESDESDNNLSM